MRVTFLWRCARVGTVGETVGNWGWSIKISTFVSWSRMFEKASMQIDQKYMINAYWCMMDFKFKSSQTRDHYHKLKWSPRLLIGALNRASAGIFIRCCTRCPIAKKADPFTSNIQCNLQTASGNLASSPSCCRMGLPAGGLASRLLIFSAWSPEETQVGVPTVSDHPSS